MGESMNGSKPSGLLRRLLGTDGSPLTQKQPPKVGVVIISNDRVHADFALSLASMTYSMGLPLCLFAEKGTENASLRRNHGLELCKEYGMDWCLMMQADITFPANAVLRLLKQAIDNELDVVGASFPGDFPPYANVVHSLSGASEVVGDGLVEVRMFPIGFCLIRMSALDKMKRPYFRPGVIEEGAPIPAEYQGMVVDNGHAKVLDESYYFCGAARAAGLKIWLDLELSFEFTRLGNQVIQLQHTQEENSGTDKPKLVAA